MNAVQNQALFPPVFLARLYSIAMAALMQLLSVSDKLFEGVY
ncbi:MAG: hypothetical protein NWQ13_00225 [Glaciimonas sp.]|nr:hypothetical protein [Glaciimonas sp.]